MVLCMVFISLVGFEFGIVEFVFCVEEEFVVGYFGFDLFDFDWGDVYVFEVVC